MQWWYQQPLKHRHLVSHISRHTRLLSILSHFQIVIKIASTLCFTSWHKLKGMCVCRFWCNSHACLAVSKTYWCSSYQVATRSSHSCPWTTCRAAWLCSLMSHFICTVICVDKACCSLVIVSGTNGSESLCRDGTKTRWWLQWVYQGRTVVSSYVGMVRKQDGGSNGNYTTLTRLGMGFTRFKTLACRIWTLPSPTRMSTSPESITKVANRQPGKTRFSSSFSFLLQPG